MPCRAFFGKLFLHFLCPFICDGIYVEKKAPFLFILSNFHFARSNLSPRLGKDGETCYDIEKIDLFVTAAHFLATDRIKTHNM